MGLGRGFDSLIPTELLDEEFDPTAAQDEKMSDLRHLRLAVITPDPEQPRRMFDDVSLDELAESIKAHGILQPIVVRPYGDGYMIVAGERRYHAAKRAGLDKIPAIIRTLSNQHKLELSLIENLQRKDLNVLETATAYLKLRDQFNLTLDQIGHRVGGKSVAAISNTLRLLRLPESVREALADGLLREGQARPLIGLEVDVIEKVLPRILQEEWSSRAIEQYVNRIKAGDQPIRKTSEVMLHQQDAEMFQRRFKAPVSIRTSAKGSGQIVIRFTNNADFARLAKLLKRL